jgi:hypothetical protein
VCFENTVHFRVLSGDINLRQSVVLLIEGLKFFSYWGQLLDERVERLPYGIGLDQAQVRRTRFFTWRGPIFDPQNNMAIAL